MHITDITPDQRLLDLQHASYAIEAQIIGDDRIPPLHEDLAALKAEPLLWLGARDDAGNLVGAIAWEETPGLVDINRLVVDPGALRQGIGRTLVKEVLARAGGRKVVVSTGRGNTPARTLYERLGFTHVEDVEVIPGLWVTSYELV
ncbi:GNAT family N-acetyltransferase [Nonomuraea typhae]|uniref:GNAT family N-acetyltransferase n=1 Tax=Nonomuraea typhae TaxID=2603600 RepID=UPI001C678560|nr:GNAT family N-acetyltransferase [Nonomuraea typhae]